MSTDVARLVVAMEARTKAFENALNRANGVANRRAKQIENRFQQMNNNISSSFQNTLRNATALAGIGFSTREIIQYSDAWTQAGNMISAAATSAGVQTRSLDQLTASANAARTSLTDYTELYARLIRSASGVAKSEQEIALATDLVSKAMKAGGASAQEQQASLIQLGQALGSGVLQGDELRSLRENAPVIVKAIADEFQTTIAGLKDLGSEGKLTSDRVFRAIINAQQGIEAQFNATNATISDSFTILRNNLVQYIGNASETYGLTATLNTVIQALAGNIDNVAVAAAAASIILLSQYVPAMARVALAGATMVATNPFLILVAGISAAAFAISAFGDEIQPIAGELANLHDYAAVAWEGIKLGATEAAQVTTDAFLSVVNALSQAMDETKAEWTDVGSFIVNEIDGLIGAFRGLVAETKVIFNELPAAVAEYVLEAMNAMIAGVENGLQKALNAINAVSRALNSVDSFFGVNPILKDDFKVDLGRVENTYAGAGKVASDAWNSALGEGNKKYFTEYLQQVRNQANARARDRVASGKDNDLLTTSADNTKGFGGGVGGAGAAAGGKQGKKGGGRSRPDELQREIEQIKERTASLQAETAAQAQINPLIDDYDYAITKARATQELLNAAKKAGIEITPALKEQIDGLAEGYANATVQANQLAESQDQAREAADFFKGSMMDAFQSMIPAIETGNSALDKFLNTLIEAVLQATLLGKGPLAGIFGGGGSGFLGGIGKIFGFDKGGYTGNGGKHEPAGVVHKCEYVFDQDAVRAAGGPAALEAMRRGLKGYANGGYVGPLPTSNAPTAPGIKGMRGQGSNETIRVMLQDDSGRMASIADQRIQTAAGPIVEVSVRRSTATVKGALPSMIADAQSRKM